MKVQFTHKLVIGHSRVFEAISLVATLMGPEAHKNLLDLTPFDALVKQHQPFFDRYASFHFNWLEFALVVDERNAISKFVEDLDSLSLSHLLVAFLESEIDEKAAQMALQDLEGMTRCLSELKIDAGLASYLLDFHDLLTTFKNILLDIDVHPVFNRTLDDLVASGQYDQVIDTFKLGLKDRHPLSYAQELMGKPFWNIADYHTYEFIIVHYISPYRMRLMNGEKMIYVHSLIRKNSENALDPALLSERLKIIGDATRLKILKMLHMKPMYGKEIAETLGLTTATVSHHLDALRQQGLINMEQVKQIKYFSTNFQAVKSLQLDLGRYLNTDKSL